MERKAKSIDVLQQAENPPPPEAKSDMNIAKEQTWPQWFTVLLTTVIFSNLYLYIRMCIFHRVHMCVYFMHRARYSPCVCRCMS